MMVMSNCQSSWHNIQQAFQLLLPKVIWIFHKIIFSAICINPEKKSWTILRKLDMSDKFVYYCTLSEEKLCSKGLEYFQHFQHLHIKTILNIWVEHIIESTIVGYLYKYCTTLLIHPLINSSVFPRFINLCKAIEDDKMKLKYLHLNDIGVLSEKTLFTKQHIEHFMVIRRLLFHC